MDALIEARFVETFVCKRQRKRLWRELTTPQQRKFGISRICHDSDVLYITKLRELGHDLDRDRVFMDNVRAHDTECYVLSADVSLDGQTLMFSDALRAIRRSRCAAVIVGTKFALAITEPMSHGRCMNLYSTSPYPYW